MIRFDNFSDKFVSGNTRKTIISALELEIGVTNSANQQPNQSVSLGPFGPPDITDTDTPLIQLNSQHERHSSAISAENFPAGPDSNRGAHYPNVTLYLANRNTYSTGR